MSKLVNSSIVKTCKNCNSIIENAYRTQQYCSDSCKTESAAKATLKRKIQKSHLKFPDGTDPIYFIECKMCGLRAPDLGAHYKTHGMTPVEFRRTHEHTKCQHTVDSLKGENNPGYQHGGRLSPFSKKFVNYTTEEDRYELSKKAKQSMKENGNDSTTIDYYLKRGLSTEDAKEALRKRQTTFTLEKCIEKYGVEAGHAHWVTRQEKWQSTLSNKTIEELAEINRRKATRINYRTLWGQELSDDGHIYCIKIDDTTVKIGITTKDSISDRYTSTELNGCKLLKFEKSSLNHVFQCEQLLKHKYRNNTSKNNIFNQFGWTETFFNVNINTILTEIDELLIKEDETGLKFNDQFK